MSRNWETIKKLVEEGKREELLEYLMKEECVYCIVYANCKECPLDDTEVCGELYNTVDSYAFGHKSYSTETVLDAVDKIIAKLKEVEKNGDVHRKIHAEESSG